MKIVVFQIMMMTGSYQTFSILSVCRKLHLRLTEAKGVWEEFKFPNGVTESMEGSVGVPYNALLS